MIRKARSRRVPYLYTRKWSLDDIGLHGIPILHCGAASKTGSNEAPRLHKHIVRCHEVARHPADLEQFYVALRFGLGERMGEAVRLGLRSTTPMLTAIAEHRNKHA
jgi:hypothetical protein